VPFVTEAKRKHTRHCGPKQSEGWAATDDSLQKKFKSLSLLSVYLSLPTPLPLPPSLPLQWRLGTRFGTRCGQ